jgi:hypothetical protein
MGRDIIYKIFYFINRKRENGIKYIVKNKIFYAVMEKKKNRKNR